MSKPVSTELFELIRSFSRSEKGYAKRWLTFSIGSGTGKLVRLFDLMDRQQIYDEETVRKKAGFSKPQLANLKRILYFNLLGALDDFNAGKTLTKKIRRLLSYTEDLSAKGLYDQSLKTLYQAKKLFLQTEEPSVHAEILLWERKLARLQSISSFSEQKLKELKNESDAGLHSLEEEAGYDWLSLWLLKSHYRFTSAPNTATESELKKLYAHPLLKEDAKPGTFRAKYYYHVSHALIARITNDFKKCRSHLIHTIQLFNEHPLQLREKQREYLSSLINLTITEAELGNYQASLDHLDRIKKIIPANEGIARETFILAFQIELEILIRNGLFAEAQGLIVQNKEQLQRYESRMSPAYLLTIHYMCAKAWFGNGDFKKALKEVNFVMNHPASETRLDLQCAARLFAVIIHFEMGHSDILDYLARSSKRYIQKQESDYAVDRELMNFVRLELPKINFSNKKEIASAFSTLRSKLNRLRKDENENEVMRHFDFISWVDSKIENKSFGEAVRRKNPFK